MHPAISQKLPHIVELCRKHRVRRLDLFGSALGVGFDSGTSDADFLVEFEPGVEKGFRGVYFGLLADLEQLLGRRIDLVEIGAVRNRFFRASINATKVPLYAAA